MDLLFVQHLHLERTSDLGEKIEACGEEGAWVGEEAELAESRLRKQLDLLKTVLHSSFITSV
jgi:hypothetical protein